MLRPVTPDGWRKSVLELGAGVIETGLIHQYTIQILLHIRGDRNHPESFSCVTVKI